MTIVVAAAAPDGLALASDSRTTLIDVRRHRVASDSARKVLAPYPTIGLATHGSAFVGEQTIAGLVDEFVKRRDPKASTMVDDLAADLAEYFSELLAERAKIAGRDPKPGTLGLIVAGYDDDAVGRIREIRLPPGNAEAIIPHDRVNTRSPGVVYRGRTRYIRRLVEGYDADNLDEVGVDLAEDTHAKLRGLGYRLMLPVSLQDAVDQATYIVRMTVDMERITDGTLVGDGDVPACGGAIQALVVTTSGARWIARPRLRISPAGLAEDPAPAS